jgi:hypothetical protein
MCLGQLLKTPDVNFQQLWCVEPMSMARIDGHSAVCHGVSRLLSIIVPGAEATSALEIVNQCVIRAYPRQSRDLDSGLHLLLLSVLLLEELETE